MMSAERAEVCSLGANKGMCRTHQRSVWACLADAQRDKAAQWAALSSVSGALVDAMSIAVGDPETFGESVRQLTKERDDARRRIAELEQELGREVERLRGELDAMRAAHPESDCYASYPKLRQRAAALEGEVVKMRNALDAIYNHNEAARAAVVQHYGLHHSEIPRPAPRAEGILGANMGGGWVRGGDPQAGRPDEAEETWPCGGTA